MQPDISEEFHIVLQKSENIGEYDLDLSLRGSRLRPIASSSLYCKDYEVNYHGFVGEIRVGSVSITKLHKCFRGTFLYWMTDCNAISEVLEYTQTVYQLRHWSQKLLTYSFGCTHRSAAMMVDVYALSQRYGVLITAYLVHTHRHSISDRRESPRACINNIFYNSKVPCCKHQSKLSCSAKPVTRVALYYVVRRCYLT